MTMGRPRKPTAVKKRQGTYRKHRAPKNPVVPPIKYPSCPSGLDAGAKREWRRLQKILEPLAYITEADRGPLEDYCRTQSMIWEAAKLVRQGLEIAMAKGHVNALLKLQSQRDKLGGKLGLDPSERERLNVPVRLDADQDKETKRKLSLLS